MSDELARLTESFAKFPGIGPRQAQRMVYYLLRQNRAWVDDLAASMKHVKMRISVCTLCYRHFIPKNGEKLCALCVSDTRDDRVLMIVEKDMDLDNIERSGVFKGRYFVLGGTITALEKEPHKRVRLQELTARVTNAGLKEIILALSATPDGDDTAECVKQELAQHLEETAITLSTLGRGLSTGSELEYADKETIKEALIRRT